MSEWYYLRNGQQLGPVPSASLQQMAAEGELGPDDMVWKQGMANWSKAATVGGLTFATASAQAAPGPMAPATANPGIGYYSGGGGTGAGLSQEGLEMLRQTKPWVRFIAVLMFILSGLMLVGGVVVFLGFAAAGGRGAPMFMTTASLVYVALGALYMIPAVFLNRYASGIATLMGASHDQNLTAALAAQKSFWKFVGILTLVVICFYVLALLVLFVGFARR